MNFIQSIRASPLNRHGFIDVLVGINLIQAIHITLIALLFNLDAGPDDEETMPLMAIAMVSLHFTTPQDLPFPIFIRFIALFFFFYFFLKQYDLHKLEMGKGKAYLLSCILHFSVNATVIVVLSVFDFLIAAETIFSAQPGE